MSLKHFLKKIFPGVSWQDPIVSKLLKALDPFDFLVRFPRGLAYLPPYSVRVRSNGVSKQFGGKFFIHNGDLLANQLITHASLIKESSVLEIGCGCGRTAFALTKFLDRGAYLGVDVDNVSLDFCRRSPHFQKMDFQFIHLDIQNAEYNPTGIFNARTYHFPFDENSFDIIFLVSVFTHMLTDDVTNYLGEIFRMLKPGGTCMFTTFLMDRGRQGRQLSFPFKSEDHFFFNQTLPEVAIGYNLHFFQDQFTRTGLKQIYEPHWGTWRDDLPSDRSSDFSQDILFVSKEQSLGNPVS